MIRASLIWAVVFSLITGAGIGGLQGLVFSFPSTYGEVPILVQAFIYATLGPILYVFVFKGKIETTQVHSVISISLVAAVVTAPLVGGRRWLVLVFSPFVALAAAGRMQLIYRAGALRPGSIQRIMSSLGSFLVYGSAIGYFQGLGAFRAAPLTDGFVFIQLAVMAAGIAALLIGPLIYYGLFKGDLPIETLVLFVGFSTAVGTAVGFLFGLMDLGALSWFVTPCVMLFVAPYLRDRKTEPLSS